MCVCELELNKKKSSHPRPNGTNRNGGIYFFLCTLRVVARTDYTNSMTI